MLGRQRRRFIAAVLALVALVVLVHQKRASLPALPGVALHSGRRGHCRSNWLHMEMV